MIRQYIARITFGCICIALILIIPFSLSSRDANAEGSSTIPIPMGKQSIKIELAESGIYELDYAALQAAGMNVESVNPHTFQLIHRGESVAYQFIGNTNTNFESGEKIRFYGWEFDGSRYEKRYIGNTIFWLWADGTASQISTEANGAGQTISTQWRSSVTAEVDRAFSPTYFRWRNKPNEPDSFYWDSIPNNTTKDFPISLPDPVSGSADGELTAEFISSFNFVSSRIVSVTANAQSIYTGTWLGTDNVNIGGTLPSTVLNAGGANTISVGLHAIGSEAANDFVLLNRITVDYWRQFVVESDQLIFNSDEANNHDFQVSGLSESNVANLFAWDITSRTTPIAIGLQAGDLSGGMLRFGRTSAAAKSDFIVTTSANLKTPTNLSAYTPIDITPDGGAEWLAISHADFLTEVNTLADYRENTSFMSTHVVDAHHIYQQYDWGYWSPIALKKYVQEAYDNWPIPPDYLLLVGDSTQNPRQLDCETCSAVWDTSIKTFLPTDLLFEDRFLGMVPVDHTFALLDGNDLIPDIAVGRIAARTKNDVTNVVNKTIRYEAAVYGQESWLKEMLFLADNTDGGGNFCLENSSIDSGYVPSSYNSNHYCLADASSAEVQAVRTQFFGQVGNVGAGIINYRGHGAISNWAGSLVTRADTDLWANDTRPGIILSADCLDSHFAWVEQAQSLSETFLMMADAGSAAHWGSTGLGYSAEHSILHGGFYNAIFNSDAHRIGDAIKQSKTTYLNGGSGDISESYTFTLHGDPALHLDAPGYNDFNLNMTSSQATSGPGSTVTQIVQIRNAGTLPDTFTISIPAPVWGASPSTVTITVQPGQIGEVTITSQIPAGAADGDSQTVTVQVQSQATTLIETRELTITVGDYEVYLPIIIK